MSRSDFSPEYHKLFDTLSDRGVRVLNGNFMNNSLCKTSHFFNGIKTGGYYDLNKNHIVICSNYSRGLILTHESMHLVQDAKGGLQNNFYEPIFSGNHHLTFSNDLSEEDKKSIQNMKNKSYFEIEVEAYLFEDYPDLVSKFVELFVDKVSNP